MWPALPGHSGPKWRTMDTKLLILNNKKLGGGGIKYDVGLMVDCNVYSRK